MSEIKTAQQSVKEALDIKSEYENQLNENPGKYLNLAYLTEHKLPVFVRLNTKMGAVVIVEAKDKSGRSVSTQVPNTSLPIELSAWQDYDVLASSFHLRKLLSDRILVLVLPSQAQEELQSPSAQRKLAKIQVSKFSKESDAQLDKSYTAKPLNETLNIVPGKPEQTITPGEGVSPRLTGLILSFEEKHLSEDDFLDGITDNARTFTSIDWRHLQNKFPDSKVIQEVVSHELKALEA